MQCAQNKTNWHLGILAIVSEATYISSAHDEIQAVYKQKNNLPTSMADWSEELALATTLTVGEPGLTTAVHMYVPLSEDCTGAILSNDSYWALFNAGGETENRPPDSSIPWGPCHVTLTVTSVSIAVPSLSSTVQVKLTSLPVNTVLWSGVRYTLTVGAGTGEEKHIQENHHNNGIVIDCPHPI